MFSPEGFGERWHPPRDKEALCAKGRMLFLSLYPEMARQPTRKELYDRWQPHLHKAANPLICERADAVLAMTKSYLVETQFHLKHYISGFNIFLNQSFDCLFSLGHSDKSNKFVVVLYLVTGESYNYLSLFVSGNMRVVFRMRPKAFDAE